LQQPYQQDFADGFIRIKMNEEIKQLAIQSGLLFQRDKLSYEEKKFAELIVRECTAALFDESERLSGLYSDEDNWDSAEEYEIRSNQCIDDIALIEKHFGVEE
jgi:hypothetical protein